jgi:hypothetical protein
MLVSCLACSSTLKLEVTCFSETSVDVQRTTGRYIPEGITLTSNVPFSGHLGLNRLNICRSVKCFLHKVERGLLSRYNDGLRAGRPMFDSRQGQEIFLFSTASMPALGPTQPPIPWVPGDLSPGIERPGREAKYSPPSST